MSEIVLKYICPVSDIIFTEDFLFMRIQLSEHFTYRKLLRFTLPSVIMMVCTSIYGVVDGVFVSNFVGSDAFAAVNLIMPFLMVLGAVGFMLGTGGSALVAYTLGADNEKRHNEVHGSKGIGAHKVGHENTVHHAVDGGTNHHDDRRQGKAQQFSIGEVLG